MAEDKPPRVPPKDKPGSTPVTMSKTSSSSLRPPKSSMKRNFKHLTLPTPGGDKALPSSADMQVPGSHAAATVAATTTTNIPMSSYDSISDQFDSLELGVEFKLDLRLEDLRDLEELGFGNGGTVSKVQHVPTRTIMAKKVRM